MFKIKATIKIKDSNIKELLKQIIIIFSNEEKANSHILEYFDKHNIKYERKNMKTCDYSARIPKNEALGLPFDITLEKEILIERKASLDELSQNCCQKRTEFENEWIRAKETGADLYLVVESGCMEDIYKHKYRSQYNEKAYYNTILSLANKYNFKVDFVTKDLMPIHILRLLQLKLKHLLEE